MMAEKGKSRRTFVVIAAALLGTAVIVSVLSRQKAQGPAGFGRQEQGNTVFTVKTQAAEIVTLTDYVITNGEVESQSSIEVFPSMGGKIASLSVMLGSSVRKGDVIARVDPSEPGTNYALSPVTAPISGSIVSSPLKIGSTVSTTTAVVMIGDIANLQITVKVPERYVAEMRPGLKAEISLEAYPDAVFSATVTRVSPVVDAATRTKEIILNFDRKDSRVNAGMFAKVKLYTSEYSGFVVVPSDAVVAQDEDSYLFVVNDDQTVSRRVVKLGKAVGGLVQITENLSPGERVVTEGMLSVSDGAKIRDLSAPSESGADGRQDAEPRGANADGRLGVNGAASGNGAAGTAPAYGGAAGSSVAANAHGVNAAAGRADSAARAGFAAAVSAAHSSAAYSCAALGVNGAVNNNGAADGGSV